MSYYKMVCPYCLNECDNESVLFYGKTSVKADLSGYFGNENKISENNSSEDNWFDANSSDAWLDGASDYSSEIDEDVKKLPDEFTLNECEKISAKVEPLWTKVETAKSDNTVLQGDLLTGVSYVDPEDGQMKRATERICPHCHKTLPKKSGTMPTYMTTLIGHTSAGKTVYLTSFFRKVIMGESFSFGRGGSYGTLRFSSIKYGNNILADLAHSLCEDGILPQTTQDVFSEPIVFQVDYEYNTGKKAAKKSCLMVFIDMKGESDEADMEKRLPIYLKADGYFFMGDTAAISSVARCAGKTVDTRGNMRMVELFEESIIPHMDNGKVNAPSVLMLTKADLLYKYRRELNFPRSNAIVNPNIIRSYDKNYFGLVNNHVMQFLNAYARELEYFVRNNFDDCYVTFSSALGDVVQISDDGRISDPRLIRPVNIYEPLIYILMRIGFIPPFIDYDFINTDNKYQKNLFDEHEKWVDKNCIFW